MGRDGSKNTMIQSLFEFFEFGDWNSINQSGSRALVWEVFILSDFYSSQIYENENYKFSPSGIYYAPKFTEYEGYIEYIKGLPQYPDPEIYGFHENAAITKNQNSTNAAVNGILIT